MKKCSKIDENLSICILKQVRLGFEVSLQQSPLFDGVHVDHLFYVSWPIDYEDKSRTQCEGFAKFKDALAKYKEECKSLALFVPVRNSMFVDWHGDVLPF